MSTVMEKETFTLNKEDAARYLGLYVGEAKWPVHLKKLYDNSIGGRSEESALALIKKIIACTILLPSYDKSRITDPPENLLFACQHWSQFKERDWVALLAEEMIKDKQIVEWRNQCLSLGVVTPIEYSPVTRQAFNWLFTKAEESGVVTPTNKQDMIRKFQKLVMAYGGNVICYLFVKEEWKINKKILNWRTNYFFEKLIFENYSFEQVFKIKKQELAKTNPKLVKSIRADQRGPKIDDTKSTSKLFIF